MIRSPVSLIPRGGRRNNDGACQHAIPVSGEAENNIGGEAPLVPSDARQDASMAFLAVFCTQHSVKRSLRRLKRLPYTECCVESSR